MKSPTKDQDLGLKVTYEKKFNDIKQRAKEEERNLRRSKKEKKEKEPKFKVEELVVVTKSTYRASNILYNLVEVIDIFDDYINFNYYGILLKTTNKLLLNRIGRLIEFSERDVSYTLHPANVEPESIKWIDIENLKKE
jgi:hypothetical protein